MLDPFFPRDSRETEGPREPSFAMSKEQLGMILLLVSIGVLFIASLVAYAVTRAQQDVWRAPGSAGLPPGLIGSTLLLAGVSAAMQWSVVSIRKNRFATFNRAIVLTGVLAAAFLVGQALNWTHLARTTAGAPSLFAFTFYLLTGIHAVHVLGGLVPLGVVLWRARQREYSSSRCEGVRFCAQYWHFLGAVWLVLAAVLALGS